MVHSYLVDMLLFCQHEKEASTGESLDISHVMWSELLSAVSERKCLIYGPFIMRLIERAWAEIYPRVLLETRDLVSHEIKRLRKKDNWATPAPHTGGPSAAAAMGVRLLLLLPWGPRVGLLLMIMRRTLAPLVQNRRGHRSLSAR